MSHHRTPNEPLHEGWTGFLQRYPWHLFLTLTYQDERTTLARGRYVVGLLIARCNDSLYGPRWRKKEKGLIWVLANETTQLDALHHHMLLGGERVEALDCSTVVDLWRGLAGVAKVEPIKNSQKVCRYMTKCCAQGNLELGGPL